MKLFVSVIIFSLSVYCCQSCSTELDVDYRGIASPIDLSYQKAASFQECCSICTSNSACQAWTFVFATNVCWLKSGVGYKLATTGRISGLRNTTTTSSSTCTNIESGYVYNNNDISQPVSANSFSECCTKCGQTSGCVAWSYLVDYKYCYLKNAPHALANRRTYTNSFSGAINTVSTVTTTVAPTGSSTCSIESGFIYRNNDIGQPIVLPVGSTQNDCCARCGQTTGCVAWSYLVDYRYCYLKNALPSSANRQSYTNSYSGVFTTAPIATSVCTVTSGYIYPGSDISGEYIATPSDCCNKCGQTAGCVAWDYLSTEHYCFLKNALPTDARKTAYQNAYSGIKN